MPRTDSIEVANALHRASIRLLRMVRAVDDQTGVSAPKLSALSVLTFGGPQNLKTLARAEQVTPATMSKLVSDLEAAGLVAKRIDRADKRGVRIEVTAKGRTLMEEGRKRRLALLNKCIAKLTREERAQLAEASALMMRLAE
ncbi:MAG: MarR family transcriptional regulator [Hyphomonadaceae bacterium]|nr:MarR family transcriptional regulator [Hyphomonadaceae bacterium]